MIKNLIFLVLILLTSCKSEKWDKVWTGDYNNQKWSLKVKENNYELSIGDNYFKGNAERISEHELKLLPETHGKFYFPYGKDNIKELDLKDVGYQVFFKSISSSKQQVHFSCIDIEGKDYIIEMDME